VTQIVEMTPAQCRAARALLDWRQIQLAEAASLGLTTVLDFERGRRAVSDKVVLALRLALEQADVVLLHENGEGGVGVRLRRPK
jgi:transcriptional regulator with XRE-family HTH domain